MQYLRIKDWKSFQHYKDRNPPWIKLQTDTFQDYEFSRLQDASKLLAICIWTLASRYKDPKQGLVPADFDYIKSQCGLGEFVKIEHLKELIEQGYIIDDSNALADCKQSAIPETETYREEAEVETDIIVIEKSRAQEVVKQFDIFWADFPTNGRNKGSKKDAEAKFKIAVKKSSFNEIMQGVDNYANYLNQSGQSNQDAFRWLEKERWRDDYRITATTSRKEPTADDNWSAGSLQFLSKPN